MSQNRKENLSLKLKERGLEIREDSRLCKDFIRFGKNDVEFVVDTCEIMNFLFSKTDYEKIRSKMISDENINFLEDRRNNPYPDERECSERAKIVAIRNYLKKEKSDIPESVLRFYKSQNTR